MHALTRHSSEHATISKLSSLPPTHNLDCPANNMPRVRSQAVVPDPLPQGWPAAEMKQSGHASRLVF